MTTLTAERLDLSYANVCSQADVRRARTLLSRDRTSTAITLAPGGRERSLLELAGLGAEVWEGVDPLAYVRALRDEWHAR